MTLERIVVEFAATIERIVANQGGMDIVLCGIWPVSGQIRAVYGDLVVERAVAIEPIVANQGDWTYVCAVFDLI